MCSTFSNGAVVIVLSLNLLAEVTPFSYDELLSLGISCYHRDSCNRPTFGEFQDINEDTCECDSSCDRRGTCCIDSEFLNPSQFTRTEVCSGEQIIGVGHFYYFDDTELHSFFQVTKCDRRWDGPVQIRRLCEMEKPVYGVDFAVAIPVTNIRSGISYKNYYCALCNFDINEAVLWDVNIYRDGDYGDLISDRFAIQDIEVPEDSTDIAEEGDMCNGRSAFPLVFSEDHGYYGYWDDCSYDPPRFVSVVVDLSVPEQLERYVKGCRSNLVSTCMPGWRNVTVRLKCAGYTGIIEGPRLERDGWFYQDYYRNAHCALCNNVTNFEGFSCAPLQPGAIIRTPAYPTSFTVLFGHLLSAGGCLGDRETFVEGLGCRPVVCGPRYKVKNGKCTRS